MANELQRVGLVFTSEGAVDFKKTLRQVSDEVSQNRSEFERAKLAWDESTSSMDKLQDRQSYLAKQTATYSDKVSILEQELQRMEQSESASAEQISKKKQQLEKAKTTLAKYEKGLKDVNKEIESGSAVLKDEMSELDNKMGTLSAAAKENETAFNAVKASWSDSTSKAQKLTEEQMHIVAQMDNYGKQAQVLKQQLELLENAEEKNERAISEKRSELNQAQGALNEYKSRLSQIDEELNSSTSKLEKCGKAFEKFSDKVKSAGEKLDKVSKAAVGVGTAALATVPATQEYRKIMASLESSSELAGYSAEETKASYEKLYGVLGDDQTAATTTANLQALGLSQNELNQVINGAVGAWAKYGDSIPIDGLAESINETVRAGTITGTFADVVNWGSKENERFGVTLKANTEANKEWNDAVNDCETAEDFFNLAMQDAGSQAERMNLVMQLLSDQGLTQAGEKWQENNGNLIEGNKATANLQEATAELAETMAPIVTNITEIMTQLLEKFNELPEGSKNFVLCGVVAVAALSPLFKIIGTLTGGVGKFVVGLSKIPGIVSVVGTGLKGLFVILTANPIGIVVAAIAALIAIFVVLYKKCDWFRNGVNKAFEALKNGVKKVIDKIKNFMKFEWKLPKLKLPQVSIKGKFSLSPPSVPKFSIKWNADGVILNKPTLFGMAGGVLQGGGEAGKEAVLPIEKLKRYIKEELQFNNQYLAEVFKEALKELKIICENNIQIGNREISEIVAKAVMKIIDSNQVGRNVAKGALT